MHGSFFTGRPYARQKIILHPIYPFVTHHTARQNSLDSLCTTMTSRAGPSNPRSSLKGRSRVPNAGGAGGADERTPLIADSSRPYTSTSDENGRGRSQSSQRRSKLNVTIASPTPSIHSVSDVYADEYDAEEGDDDGREVEVYVPGKSTSLQTVRL